MAPTVDTISIEMLKIALTDPFSPNVLSTQDCNIVLKDQAIVGCEMIALVKRMKNCIGIYCGAAKTV